MTEFGMGLLSDISTTFNAKIKKDSKLKRIANKVRDGTDYEIASDYSIRVGELLSESIQENTKSLAYMSREVAEEVLPPLLTVDHNMVTEVTDIIQQNMNVADGVMLGVQTPALDTNRINGFVEKVASYSDFDGARWVLGEPIVNYSQSIVDQAVRDNAKASAKAGVTAYIVRKAEASATVTRGRHKYHIPCKWCSALEGTYEYLGNGSNIPHEVYQKHEACRCTLTFKRGNFRQNVWDHSETWTEDDSAEQESIVKKAMPKETVIPDNDIVNKLGEPAYRKIDEHVQSVGENYRKVWKKYENDIVIADSQSRRGAFARGKYVHFNLESDLNPSRKDEKELQVFFHETHHAIDSLAVDGAFHFSSQYKDHLFPNTIVDEVQELIKSRGEQVKLFIKNGDVKALQDNGLISEWTWKYFYNEDISKVKYSKSMAYTMLQNEVRELPDVYRGDLSDILEGATNGKITCGYGHGKKYWTDRTYYGVRDGLATEAFAEMSDSTYSNQESLETIKKYLPKSYAVYKEMIEYLAQ